HAIETALGYGAWLHGEAVAAGTMMAAELSRRLGWLSATDVERTEALFVKVGLPVNGPDLASADYLRLMAHDKKVEAGDMRLVLLNGLGRAVVKGGVDPDEIRAAIDARRA